MRQSWETMTSVSAGHIILTPSQPVGSGQPQRESNPGPPHQESRALPQSYRAPPPPPKEERDRQTDPQGDRKRCSLHLPQTINVDKNTFTNTGFGYIVYSARPSLNIKIYEIFGHCMQKKRFLLSNNNSTLSTDEVSPL